MMPISIDSLLTRFICLSNRKTLAAQRLALEPQADRREACRLKAQVGRVTCAQKGEILGNYVEAPMSKSNL